MERCGLYGVKSLQPLAMLLWHSAKNIRDAAQQPDFEQWIEEKPGKKPRKIQDPRGVTETLHYRLFELLDRVSRPDFLHSATRGRTYVSNARQHLGGAPSVLTDMKGCFESTSIASVARFFHEDLRMAHDLAWKLARICCINGHLATGSCLSPLLAYWCHRETFDWIYGEACKRGIVMTLYIDDLVFSGAGATLRFLHLVKNALAQIGLKTHKDKSFGRNQRKHVTGIVVTKTGLHVPNKRLHKIIESMGPQPIGADPVRRARSLSGSIASTRAISRLTAKALAERAKKLSNH